MKNHPVFYISLLQLAADDSYPTQKQDPTPLVLIDREEEYKVKEVFNSRTN